MGKTLIESFLGETGDLTEWSEDKLDPAVQAPSSACKAHPSSVRK